MHLETHRDTRPKIRAIGLSDVGRRRAVNEDAYLVENGLGLYVVADGMGGHAAGEIASREAIDSIYGMVNRGRSVLDTLNHSQGPSRDALRKASRLLESAVQSATYMVFGMGQEDPNRSGMGTTVSALLLSRQVGILAQVGDSRIYMVRDGQGSQLTEDHTLVAWQVREGLLSQEEALVSPHRNVITRAVGSHDYVQVDLRVVEHKVGDIFVLCSDGLHTYLETDEIALVVRGSEPPEAARTLIEMANQRGGRDNITAVVVAVER